MMLAFLITSSRQKITCWQLQQIHSSQKISLSFADKHIYSFHFFGCCCFEWVPWVAEVWSVFTFFQHIHLLGQTDNRKSTAHLSPKLWMDYLLKLQGHISMTILIGMSWIYLMVLAWCINFLSLSAGAGAPQLQHFGTSTMLLNCLTCRWRGTLFSGKIGTQIHAKISFWSENMKAKSRLIRLFWCFSRVSRSYYEGFCYFSRIV